ncbi:MAG TPA: GNAT family N-acetyltransferase [Puia sp.]|nr:GNAT family N-acetyltransferase [Puia sp.]
MSDNLSIHQARETDIPGILEIYNDAILNTTALYTYEPFTLPMMQQWFAEKKAKALPVFVAAAGEGIAGFASYGPFRPWPAYKYSVEHSIYVHKDQRGKGISKILLRTLIDHASAGNLHTIVAGIDSQNEVSINLHRQFGFKEMGQIAQVGYKFGRWLDLVFMQLILENNLQPNEK